MTLSFLGRRWQWPSLPALTAHDEAMRQGQLPDWVHQLICQRGINQAELSSYLTPSLAQLLDPKGLCDIEPALARLMAAKAAGEKVMIWGDYDVDGVCATTVMVSFLRQLGMACDYFIPDRRGDGYGLSAAGLVALAGQCSLVVAVDCGSSQHDEILAATQAGLDVIVVDHHQMPRGAPNAIACINPHRIDCGYADKDLCAAGLAFMVAMAMRRALRHSGAFLRGPEPDLRPLLDVVALATVADMVPLLKSNRALVAAGLRRIRSRARPGILALCEVADIAPKEVTAADIGFRLGPRINARGRVAHAGIAVELMLAPTLEVARPIAHALNAANTERRALEKKTFEQAREQAEAAKDCAALVVYDPAWHPGVLGLVASRLVALYHRPAVVIGEGGKASGRSIKALNLYACLSSAAHVLTRFGGHPMAAGLTVQEKNVSSLRALLNQAVHDALGPPPFAHTLAPDAEISATMLSLKACAALAALEPFGQGNPEPVFVARAMCVKDARNVGDNHLKLRLGTNHSQAIGFGMGHLLAVLPPVIDCAFSLQKNTYKGQTEVQLRLLDLHAGYHS